MASFIRSANPSSPTVAMTRSSASEPLAEVAAVTTVSACARASSSSAAVSSSTENRAGTFASNGKRCRIRSQKAWIVWIFSPPGVSTARANRRRASSSRRRSGGCPSTAAMACASAASSSVTQPASVENTLVAMLAAAALVKVSARMQDGSVSASNSRITRWASTWVLPEPAWADTQAEAPGLELAYCLRRVSASTTGPVTLCPPRQRRRATIPARGQNGHRPSSSWRISGRAATRRPSPPGSPRSGPQACPGVRPPAH